MYTQCPECETTFKLGADDLRRANGKVRCGDCDHVFNALEYLAEEVEETEEDLAVAAASGEARDGWTSSERNPTGELDPDLDDYETSAYIDQEDEDRDELEESDFGEPDDDGPILLIDNDDAEGEPDTPTDDDDAEATTASDDDNDDGEDGDDVDFDDEVWEQVPGVAADSEPTEADEVDAAETPAEDSKDADDLEFNVPEDKWGNFFGPLPKGQTAAVWQPPQLDDDDTETSAEEAWAELTEDEHDGDAPDGNGEIPDEGDGAPSWKDTETETSNNRLYLLGGIALAVIFVTQLVHYNRDQLAASESWGSNIRAVYGAFGAPLYPEWSINDYEIRGSEAVAGETGRDILDIRAQIANTGTRATGLPRLRILLKDRWSNPVAAQDFSPEEYNSDLAADALLAPGEMISAHVSIQDPGSGAQGFEVELCLPRRDMGLECTGQPFK
ncbi:MAG: DUF3426 domain-containing protein [Gammaproteobacteria bacterium]|nr:DUF3426 domain-containing protein [Gammaproteobacteria bacterium]